MIIAANRESAAATDGRFAATVNGKPAVMEYESDTDLRDTEQILLLEEGDIAALVGESEGLLGEILGSTA